MGSGSSEVAFYRRHNPLMGTAPTQIPREGFIDLRVCWIFIVGEKGAGGHDHAVDAIAALYGLLIDERLLQFPWFFCAAQPFERGDALALHSRSGRYARAHGLAVYNDRTGPALSKAAAKLRSVDFKVVPQCV